jgi:ketosteroid isomerase-like protein
MKRALTMPSIPSTVALMLVAGLLSACTTTPQQSADDVAAIAAADQAFYSALNGRSVQGMSAVWTDKPYAISIGPRSKVMDVGGSAVRKYWEGAFDFFPQISVTKSDTKIQTDGKLAWVIGIEHAVLQPKTGGEPLRFDTFVTHVFEKENGRWLLVSHHAQMIPR